MYTTKTKYFTVTPSEDSELVLQKVLLPGWQLNALSSTREHLDFYDTFEWNAYEKKVAIIKKKASLSLIDLHTGQETASALFNRNLLSFSPVDLPSGTLKDILSAYSDIRAFIRICSIDTFIRTYHIFDDNKKPSAF